MRILAFALMAGCNWQGRQIRQAAVNQPVADGRHAGATGILAGISGDRNQCVGTGTSCSDLVGDAGGLFLGNDLMLRHNPEPCWHCISLVQYCQLWLAGAGGCCWQLHPSGGAGAVPGAVILIWWLCSSCMAEQQQTVPSSRMAVWAMTPCWH